MKIKDRERRCFSEIRVDSDEDGDGVTGTIVGHAAVFNSPADIGGFFREQIKPGAFAEAIRNDDVRALIDHDSTLILGRNRAGTLKLSEDDRGLRVEITPPLTQIANDLLISMRRGDVNQMSFGFRMKGGVEEWDDTGDMPLRTIEKVGQLLDVSVVTFPAFEETDAAVRSLETYREAQIVPVDIDRMHRRLRLAEHIVSG